MRIALAWIVPTPLVSITVRYERYVRGLVALGHDVVTVCHRDAAAGYEFSTITVNDLLAFREAEFWKSLPIDAIVTISWLAYPEIIEAMHASGKRIIAVTDSDGVLGVRVHPVELLRRMTVQHGPMRMKLAGMKFWSQLYARGLNVNDRSSLRSATASNSIAVTSDGAKQNLEKFFRHHERPELCNRVIVVPYPIDDVFLSDTNVTLPKKKQIVAIGRWDDPQKDPSLLAAAIKRIARQLPDTNIMVVGKGGEKHVGRKCRGLSNVHCLGRISPDEISACLLQSRILLITSRWESGPIVANEALAVGCSLVGPAWISTLAAYCQGDHYGTLFHRRSAFAVQKAIATEMLAWEDGRRSDLVIRQAATRRFSPIEVCRQLLLEPTSRQTNTTPASACSDD
ncbi:MAG: glycosyltransferase family 4 protein [Pirellulales bacterium]